MKNRLYFRESFYRVNELADRSLRLHRIEVKGPKDKPKKQYVEFEDNSNSWDAALDKEVLAVLMRNYREQVEPQYLPKFYQTIDKDLGGD